MNLAVCSISSIVLFTCAGAAMASAPRLEKANMIPTRLVPSTIAPVYIIDGLEVVGPEIPYSDVGPAVLGKRVVFDQFDGDETNLGGYPPIDRGGPCGGGGFLYAANTDSNSADHYSVRIAASIDDWKGMDSFGIGKHVAALSYCWMHNTSSEGVRVTITARDTFNETDDPTNGGRISSGAQSLGLQVTYYGEGLGTPVPSGFYFTYIDISGLSFPSPLLDSNGTISFTFTNPITGQRSAADQPATWGTRVDELPVPSSRPRPGGQQNPYWYIDDNGALHSTPYILANAVSNGTLVAGTNETYATGPNTDPAFCFRSTGIMWAMFVNDCVAVDAVTLNSPANGATDVANNFPHGPSFTFTPGPNAAPHYIGQIKKNGQIYQSTTGAIGTTFDIPVSLPAGQHFGWSVISDSGGNCPSAESETFTFQVAGCAADFNGDDIADFFDYLDFVSDFSQSNNNADFNADQIIDFFDYLDFVQAFSAGCGG